MNLLIVESPTKTKTIGKYLGDTYKVTSSIGHIRDLPKSNKKAIDIEAGFIPNYEISPDKHKVVKELISLSKKAEIVYLAMDPDREGEAIAWHIFELLKEAGIDTSKIKRISFNEITKTAIQEALLKPGEIDQNLRKAQEARRVLDRLVGYDLSGIIWKKVRYGLSAGRVQSPALRILVEKEKLIKAFIPDVFWKISANLKSSSSSSLEFICKEEPKAMVSAKSDDNERKSEIYKVEQYVKNIVSDGKSGNWKIIDIKETDKKRKPRAPFTTSTLQQTASSRFGFSPSKSMQIAQKLYEAGHITYMRTDSVTLSNDALTSIKKTISLEFGANQFESRKYKSKSKNSQEAHEAIRPSKVEKKIAGTTEDQKKLYNLIRSRTLASQMIDASIKNTRIVANIEGNTIPDFKLTGSRVISQGWLQADTMARKEDVELPKLNIGDKLDLLDIHSEQKETSPPSRYTEAGLVRELEKRGIGRPSTYASIIRTIQNRGYVEKENGSLKPTDTGEVVSDFLSEQFEKYISDDFTEKMENELDEIALGKREYKKTLEDFYVPFKKIIKSKEKLEKATDLGDADPEMKCPKCEGPMLVKLAKTGKFLSCKKFPDCVGARTLEGKELEGPKETGEICPKCKKGKLVEREGRFGKFISCNNYPKCKFIKEDEKEIEKKKTDVKCPLCKKGHMMERNGRFGVFYSCTEYPDCKNAIKAKPTGRYCDYIREEKNSEKCGALMMEGTKTIPERCSDKSCPNHRPDRLIKKKNK